MRLLNITLNDNNTANVPEIFSGYVEENNATMLKIKLNSELCDSSIDYHVVNFRHGENDEKLVSGKIEEYIEGLSDETDAYRIDDTIYIKLPQYVTGYPDIYAQVEGHYLDYDVNTCSTYVSEIVKSPIFNFTLKPSITGNQGEFNNKVDGIFAQIAPYVKLKEQVESLMAASIREVADYNSLPDIEDENAMIKVKNSSEYSEYESVPMITDFFDADEFRITENPPQPTEDDFANRICLEASVHSSDESYLFSIMPEDEILGQMCYYFRNYDENAIYAYIYSDFTAGDILVSAGWVKLSNVRYDNGSINHFSEIINVDYEDIVFPKNCSIFFMNLDIDANKNTQVYEVLKTKEHLPGYYIYKSGKWDLYENTVMLSQLKEDESHMTITAEEKSHLSGWFLEVQGLQTQMAEKADTTDIPTELSELQDDNTHRTVTDSEKTTWNNMVHTVRFLNTSGTVLLKSTVKNGQTAFYWGETPVYDGTESGTFSFTGWNPSIDTPVTADTDFVAQYVDTATDFATASWSTIRNIAYSDTCYKNSNNQWCTTDGQGQEVVMFEVGDEKTITLTDGEEITLQIYDFQHDEKTSGGVAPITIGMKNLMATTQRIHLTGAETVDWSNCDMRTTVMQEIYAKLPTDLKNVIAEVNKKSTAYYAETEIITSADKIWLFSQREADDSVNGYAEEGTKYPIFTDTASRVKYRSNGSGTAFGWWLRSQMGFFRDIGAEGASHGNAQNTLLGVCFGFCI